MSENQYQFNFLKNQKALRRLVVDLSAVNAQSMSTPVANNEMLSLIVDEAIKGIDISKNYPTFYKKLLNNPDLRQAFLDALESIELAEKAELINLPEVPNSKLDFLTAPSLQPIITKRKDKWQISWQRTIDQLQALFSPAQLVYRSDPTLYDDPWFTLLRGEVEIDGTLYAIALECTLSENDQESLSPFLKIAVTVESTTEEPQFPIQTSLQWGQYNGALRILEEGRARFPDIPFTMIFDEDNKNIIAELNLILEPVI